MNKNKTCVMVDFWISGENFDVDLVTQELNITPTQTRHKQDFPDPLIGSTEWSVSTGYEESSEISTQFEKLVNILKGKENSINSILNKNNLDCGFLVVTQVYDHEAPIMEFSNECVKFAGKINAKLNFDLYYY